MLLKTFWSSLQKLAVEKDRKKQENNIEKLSPFAKGLLYTLSTVRTFSEGRQEFSHKTLLCHSSGDPLTTIHSLSSDPHSCHLVAHSIPSDQPYPSRVRGQDSSRNCSFRVNVELGQDIFTKVTKALQPPEPGLEQLRGLFSGPFVVSLRIGTTLFLTEQALPGLKIKVKNKDMAF